MDYNFKEKPAVNLDDIDAAEQGLFGRFNLRKIIIFAAGIIFLILIGMGLFFLIKNLTDKPEPTPQPYDTSMSNVFFAIADSMSFGEGFESVIVSVSNHQLHDKEDGWINVSGNVQQYDLVALN